VQEAIVTQGLTRRFGEIVAVDQLTLSVNQGEVFGFLGPNGAGKTTTVRLLAGVLSADAGLAQVLGLDVATRAADIRGKVGVLTETPNLYEGLSARDNLLFFGRLYGLPAATLPGRVDDLLAQFELSDRADDLVGAYSKGMRQRLAVARALIHRPSLLFLDEPTASLDPAAARMVTDLIQKLGSAEGHTVFICTHNLAEAQRLCDRVGVIDRGRLRAIGTPRELERQLWQRLGVEIDLHGQPSPQVGQVLADMPAVLSQSMDGDKLLLELDDQESIPEVVAAITAAGGRIYGVRTREHTLEEIYFEIQGARDQDAGGRP